jgi:hypothetical protein
MQKRRLRPPSPALAISLIALFVALSGTGYAAFRLPKNSVGTSQLKNGAVTNKKVAKKLIVYGAKAAVVAAAAINAEHANSADTATNADQLGGLPASAYQRSGSTLPSGQTESGDYAVGGSGAGYMNEGIQFAIPLAQGLPSAHVEFVGSGVIGDSNCPGVGQAASGFLCVYEVFSTNRTPITPNTLPINNHSGAPGADAYGFMLILGSTGGSAISYGSWTVRAP